MPEFPASSAETDGRLERGASSVAGDGVFCRRPIAKGEVMLPAMTGRKLHRSEYERIDWGTYRGRIMQIDEDWFLEGTGDLVDYINHSCDPNIGFSLDGTRFVALRDIAAGEELFFHYSTCEDEAGWSLACGCGSRLCRGSIVSFRDLPAEERERLLPLSLPYLKQRWTGGR